MKNKSYQLSKFSENQIIIDVINLFHQNHKIIE